MPAATPAPPRHRPTCCEPPSTASAPPAPTASWSRDTSKRRTCCCTDSRSNQFPGGVPDEPVRLHLATRLRALHHPDRLGPAPRPFCSVADVDYDEDTHNPPDFVQLGLLETFLDLA